MIKALTNKKTFIVILLLVFVVCFYNYYEFTKYDELTDFVDEVIKSNNINGVFKNLQDFTEDFVKNEMGNNPPVVFFGKSLNNFKKCYAIIGNNLGLMPKKYSVIKENYNKIIVVKITCCDNSKIMTFEFIEGSGHTSLSKISFD